MPCSSGLAFPLLLALSLAACRERSGQHQAASSQSSAGASAASRAPALQPFRVVAKVHAAGWAALGDAGAPHNPEAERQIREHLQAAPFASSLARCYSGQSPTLPLDITVFLNLDREGRVTRSVLEGVPPAAAACVNQLFGGLQVPDFGAGNASLEGGTVSGVLDVQAL